jgi:hypothetical protein
VSGHGGGLASRPSGRRTRTFCLRRRHAADTCSSDGRTWQARLNRLVLIAFIGPPFEGAHACHRNGDNQDNRLENLYWGTAKENAQDKKRCGTHATGEKVNRSKLKRKQVAEMKELHAGGGWTYDQLGEKYRVNGSTVWRAINGKTWEEG